MKLVVQMAKIAILLLFAQSANAATISYSFEFNATLTLDGTSTVTAVPITVSGTGNTDDIFNLDGTRIANTFDATFTFGGSSYSGTELIYAVRAGGTLALAADISGTSIATVVSGNTVPLSYGLNSDAAFMLNPALTFGSFDTDGGLLTIDGFAPDSALVFASNLFTSPPAAVPLPAGGLLLLSGFGAVAALKRRKKRAA